MSIDRLRRIFKIFWIALGIAFIPLALIQGFSVGKIIGVEALIFILGLTFDLVFKYAYKNGYWDTDSGDIILPEEEDDCDLTYKKR